MKKNPNKLVSAPTGVRNRANKDLVLCHESNLKLGITQWRYFPAHWRNNCVQNTLILFPEKGQGISETDDNAYFDKSTRTKASEMGRSWYKGQLLEDLTDESRFNLDGTDDWSNE